MAGIYIHIPFCKQACSYCNFHFSTQLNRKKEVFGAIQLELAQRADYVNKEEIETIYFGGGTPSLLSLNELNSIFDCINQHFSISPKAEITLEANPDDLTLEKLIELKKSKVNRLSIGVQSFFDKDLVFMNRAHSANEAKISITEALGIGFENLTVDLIYGNPTTTNEMWKQNLDFIKRLGVNHLSAYSLTVEERTALAAKIAKGQLDPINENKNYEQYSLLTEFIKTNKWKQYELSNFCKGENYSKHNTSYWKGITYLGIGPSAHSFNGTSRQWNVSNNIKYVNLIKTDKPYFEIEKLSEVDQYHELLITSLRTAWGLDIELLENSFSKPIVQHFHSKLKTLDANSILLYDNRLIINQKALFQSDEVVRKLMI